LNFSKTAEYRASIGGIQAAGDSAGGFMIEVQNLSRRFGAKLAVDDVSFKVDKGEVLGFLGPNGAGKSTTMRMITGYLAPTSGRAKVCGFDVAGQPIEVKRRIGYLPESAPSWPDMRVIDFLRFAARVRGLEGEAQRDAMRRVVAQCHLDQVLGQQIETLSKGFRQRTCLAQALIHDPEVLVLDEPTDGLDPNQKHEMRALIRDMARTRAVLFSTHILEEVDEVCTRAIVIDRGRVVADGTPAQLRSRVPSGRLDDFFRSVTRSDLETDAQGGAPAESNADGTREERIAQ
jgi:ABC-2 type transport system ATP-binding protein